MYRPHVMSSGMPHAENHRLHYEDGARGTLQMQTLVAAVHIKHLSSIALACVGCQFRMYCAHSACKKGGSAHAKSDTRTIVAATTKQCVGQSACMSTLIFLPSSSVPCSFSASSTQPVSMKCTNPNPCSQRGLVVRLVVGSSYIGVVEWHVQNKQWRNASSLLQG